MKITDEGSTKTHSRALSGWMNGLDPTEKASPPRAPWVLKTNHKICQKRLTGNLYAPPVGLQLVRNSTLSVPLPIPLKLKACLSVPVNWKVYVCPPDFVLDHDWLAIPKVTTVCRVSLPFFTPCFRNMLFQTYHIKCSQFQLYIDVNVF